MKRQTSFLGNKLGYTLLELIVAVTIIGTMSLLIAPSFTFSEESAEKQFAPFRSFIEKQRNKAISDGKPVVLELEKHGKLRVVSLEKDADDHLIVIAEMHSDPFSFKIASGEKEKAKILLMPNGTMEPLVITLDRISKQLLYNGTSARGRLL